MVKLVKGFKVFMLLEEGYAAGRQPEEVGWQAGQDPDIKDGVLMIKNGLKTQGVPLRIIHGFSIEPVYVE